ncbi:DUF6660 family protein [Sphingobacterium multivorum]|uniref:DUF6660 family protein n=1 Tax=Sphingobacterium multivorum TaxID=28454 RepID=UPI0035E423BC
MKFITLILAILVLALSAIPCCALESPSQSDDHLEYRNTKSDNHEHDNDCCSHCSPFYSCGSCFGFVPVGQLIIHSESFSAPIAEHYSVYLHSYLQELYSSIWQPPKIV